MNYNEMHAHSAVCIPVYGGVGRPPKPWCERFFAKVRVAPNECWIWKPCEDRPDSERYGHGPVFSANWGGKHSVIAYKWLWEWQNGPVPSGLELDHKCHNWRCVNPGHLEPVTPKENGARYAAIRADWTVRDDLGRFAGRRR